MIVGADPRLRPRQDDAHLGRLPAALRPAHGPRLGRRRLHGSRKSSSAGCRTRAAASSARCRCWPPTSTSRWSRAPTRRPAGCSGTSCTSIPAPAAEFSAVQSVVDFGRVRRRARRAAVAAAGGLQAHGRAQAAASWRRWPRRSSPSRRPTGWRRSSASRPRTRCAEDYARFRATGEKRRESWWTWPERMRDGVLEPGDYDEEAKRYHLYVQWLADAQVKELSERAAKRGPGLYLDLPLGVNPDGYDVWRDRESFAVGVVGRGAARLVLHARPGLGLPAAAPGEPAGDRLSLLAGRPEASFPVRRRPAHRPPDGAAPLLLGAARPRRRPGRLRAATRSEELYAVYCLESIAQQVRPGRRGPGHGAAGGAAGDGEAQHPPALHRPVRDEAGLATTRTPGSPAARWPA